MVSSTRSMNSVPEVSMSDLVTALQDRISALEDEREELEDALSRIDAKLEAYRDLLAEEQGEEVAPPKRKPGRPKGSKNKKTATSRKRTTKKATKSSAHAVEDDLWKEATASLPEGASATTPEEQERAQKRFNPAPRPQPKYGVKAGKPEDVMGTGDAPNNKANVSISVEDD